MKLKCLIQKLLKMKWGLMRSDSSFEIVNFKIFKKTLDSINNKEDFNAFVSKKGKTFTKNFPKKYSIIAQKNPVNNTHDWILCSKDSFGDNTIAHTIATLRCKYKVYGDVIIIRTNGHNDIDYPDLKDVNDNISENDFKNYMDTNISESDDNDEIAEAEDDDDNAQEEDEEDNDDTNDLNERSKINDNEDDEDEDDVEDEYDTDCEDELNEIDDTDETIKQEQKSKFIEVSATDINVIRNDIIVSNSLNYECYDYDAVFVPVGA